MREYAWVMKKFWDGIDKIIYFAMYQVLHFPFKEGQWEWVCQFVKFALVGVTNTLVSYAFYLVFWKLGVYYLLANVLGYFMGIVNSFFWNNKYVFTQKAAGGRNLWQTFIKTCCSYLGVGFVLENILLVIFVQILHVHEAVGPFIVAVLIVPVNFIVNKLWAFRER